MIRTEREYEESLRRVAELRDYAEKLRASLETSDLVPDHVELAMSPTLAFMDSMQGEIRWYEQARKGEIRPLPNLTAIGLSLIALRLARGVTQRQLAERLGINEAQVSKDERNEYHGVSVERAQRVIDALEGSVTLAVEVSAPDSPRPPRPQTEREP
jgi:DNA-binding Xre family transcriptional regulator